MNEVIDAKRAAILDSAVEAFGKYGFRRTSMEDIADAAGMSRPALYQYFRNKAEIFRAGSERMQMLSIEAAKAANAKKGKDLAARLGAMLVAYKTPAWRVMHQTPHGGELIDLNASLAEDVTQRAIETMIGVLAEALSENAAAERDPREDARLLSSAAWAAMVRAESEERFEADMRALGEIWAVAVLHTPNR